MNIVELDCRLSGGPLSILVIFNLICLDVLHVQRDLGWNPGASRFEVPIVCFLVWMNFKDSRFQQCRNGVLGAGARCCSSRAIDEARDPTGHSMWTIQIFQIFQKLLGVKVIFHLWGRRCGFKASTDFWVFRSAWRLLDWVAGWAVDLCQSWTS